MSNYKKHTEEINDIREMLNKFNVPRLLSETQVISLVEERGIWPAPYKQQIENVLNKYVGNRFHSSFIKIPSKEWKFIKEIEKLEVAITLYPISQNTSLDFQWGSGKNSVKKDGHLTKDDKLDYCEITIHGQYLPSGEILKRTIYNNICHEIHHLLN